MKLYINSLLLILLVLLSCSESDNITSVADPIITLDKSSINFANEGGIESISFDANISWTAKSSEDWCKVSTENGNKGKITLDIIASKNESYYDRSCLVTIKGGNLTTTVKVSQSQTDVVVLSERIIDISSENQTLIVSLEANVKYKGFIKFFKQGL